MAWIELTLESTKEQAEVFEDLLLAVGALAVTLKDNLDEPVLEPALGTTPLWTETLVVGLFNDHINVPTVLKQLNISLPEGAKLPAYSLKKVEDQDWERACMQDFHPMQFGKRLWICPSWEQPVDPKAVNILLDPGLAFGTGTHPTTALCLEWLDGQECENKQVVDFGCGSGILAIAAQKLGAANTWAVDIDQQAITATNSNAEANDISNINTGLPEQLPESTFDILLANILAGPLESLEPKLASLVNPGGWICLSGILKEQADDIVNCYQADFEELAVKFKGDWVRVSGRKKT